MPMYYYSYPISRQVLPGLANVRLLFYFTEARISIEIDLENGCLLSCLIKHDFINQHRIDVKVFNYDGKRGHNRYDFDMKYTHRV